MAVTKAQLTEQKRGKGGTMVRLTVPLENVVNHVDEGIRRDTYVVKDLFARKTYDKPDRIGVGPADLGIAFGVSLSDIELA